ncbi:hypothetical protein DOTSEDRAFT_87703 [Dothistroma septosporum NZE10]|uniref:Uncharacterized protein n=1 Tax=Dothistroma septosporum (strain NZE10 / CBS 128990) TaxID=675120 RepID=N1PPH5_DOTSN|nr:hypothetical protein DOTSEDRAFT_87703 [Dothistroma septosporum NZE10]
MGRASPLSPSSNVALLQVIVDQQHETIQGLHDAFAKERHTWGLERQHFLHRIAQLERLLRTDDHWSPAKSPTLSPSAGTDLTPAHSRALLPTIAEDVKVEPLSGRRTGAPPSIELPTITEDASAELRRESLVAFANAEGLQVTEVPTPPSNGNGVSPPPPKNRVLAGHTPLKAPRPPTPPPGNMAMDGLEDTPTRNNTHINTLLARGSVEEEDPALTGPLNMPALPHQPDATNFTLEALSKKLAQIVDHPEEGKPLVFSQKSPGLASPASPAERDSRVVSPQSQTKSNEEKPFAPLPTHQSQSEAGSNALSPTLSHMSRNTGTFSPQEVHEAKIQAEFEQGGIKLKKKTSTNFGAPFGSLAGFGPRRTSQDKA